MLEVKVVDWIESKINERPCKIIDFDLQLDFVDNFPIILSDGDYESFIRDGVVLSK